MNEEEKTYKKLLDDLKNLPKVDAPKNFETELLRKINSSELEKKESFWDRILTPGKLAPAAVALASAAIIFFVVDINSEEMEDPLNIAPRLREDLVIIESIEEIPVEQLKKSDRVKEEPGILNEGLVETEETETQVLPNAVYEERSEMKSKGVDKSLSDELISSKLESDSFKSDDSRSLGGSAVPSPVTTSAAEISKDNLNFMQRNLSTEEKKEVQQLKMKVQTEKSSKTEQNSNK
ncbi:MAG: hypothetical protein EHM44_09740 [Ignavibacteriales bacterium]|nr:MAG: hypothetical protein EHM44_09740 [Ignavibacteriales bacterium]